MSENFINKKDNKEYPLVSIIAPCFNGENYLSRFFDSVLAQTYPSIELILVDDGSTDCTPLIVDSYRKLFSSNKIEFQYYRTEESGGAAAAINHGLALYRGSLMMWADSDDILLPDNIMEKVFFLQSNPSADFVLCQEMCVSENDLDTPLCVWKREIHGDDDHLVEDLLLSRNIVWGSGVILVRRDFFETAIPLNSIYESQQGQNYQLLLPLAYCGRCGYIDKILYKYVIRPESHAHRKRSFSEQITRQREFSILIRETLLRIPGMNDSDFRRFMALAEQQLLGNELQFSLQYGHLTHYFVTIKEMHNKGLSIHRNFTPVYYYGRRIKRTLLSVYSNIRK